MYHWGQSRPPFWYKAMKLDDFENSIDPVIMKRGQGYFKTGAIHNLEETESQFWQAYAEGTHTYDIEIALNQQTVEYWSCTCPYDMGPVCKHVAAALLCIRDKLKVDKKKTSKRLTKQEQVDKVLSKMTKEELTSSLNELLKKDRTARDRLLLQYSEHTGNKQSAKVLYRSIFNTLVSQYSSHGFIDYRSARGFNVEVWNVLDTLNPERLAPQSCVEACFSLLEVFEKKVINSIDDSDGGTADIVIGATEVLKKSYPKLTKAQQKSCFEKTIKWELESELYDYGLADYLSELPRLWTIKQTTLQTVYLNALDTAIDDKKNDWHEDSLIQRKLETLSAWGRTDEVEVFAQSRMDKKEFRQIFVDKAIAAKNYEKAYSLIDEGIEIAKQQDYPGIVSDWHKELLKIAEHRNDIDAIRESIVTLQQGSWFDVKLYRKLKATFSAEDWYTLRQGYIKKMFHRGMTTDVIIEIHFEENEFLEMLTIFQKHPDSQGNLFKYYIGSLSRAFPEETVKLYAEIIKHDLRMSGRPIYQRAAKDINQLMNLPMGKEIANTVISDMRNTYNNRPSMLEIFNIAFGKN